MNKYSIYSILACLIFTVQCVAQEQGTVKTEILHSLAIAGNIAGEDSERAVTIYLPPGYSRSNKRYPVMYLLHGTGDDHLNFVDDPEKHSTIQGLMDTGILEHRFGEMIVVTPNENTKWGGSFYVNSSVTGNWEDFTSKELVNYIDSNYRTIAKPGSRAIVGHSMGGYGAITLAMKHPDIFGVTYSLNGGFLSFAAELSPTNPEVRKFVQARSIDELLATKSQNAIALLMVAQAFSPSPDKPQFYADKPYKIVGGKIGPNLLAYNKWLERDVVKMAEKYRENLKKLRAIKFDCGDEEDITLIEINSRLLSKKMTELGIPHQFEQYNGDHRNRLWGLHGRIFTEVIPFVFDNLEK